METISYAAAVLAGKHRALASVSVTVLPGNRVTVKFGAREVCVDQQVWQAALSSAMR